MSQMPRRAGLVAILAPTGKDAALTAAILAKAAIQTRVCADFGCAEEVLAEGADVLLIAEEALDGRKLQHLADLLGQQAPWSDLPILVVARPQADSPLIARALEHLGNVTLLERPVRPATLISTIRSALKSRARQYEVRDHLLERERTEKALRDADERKDEFLATLAHELRNPLAPIRNSLHLLRLSGAAEPATEQIYDTLERQTGLLVRLVDDLLEVSRITQGKVGLRREPIELAGVIRQALEISRPFIDAFGHNVAISVAAEPLIVDGDAVRLSQVVSNLLNNASKYMDGGGQIWVSARREGSSAVISVKDTGIGIARDMLPRIFDMFTQIDRTARQAQGGLGIGLSLVRALVEMHGGEVRAKSDGLGRGSEFVVTLPLLVDGVVALEAAAPPTPAVIPRRRVLIVDDNRDGARSLSRLLQVLGTEVEIANDGASALERLGTFRPGVVLLDIGMPSMDGYEVARRIRSNPEFKNLLLIALTGWGQEQDRRRTAEAGFDHHLVKPAAIDDIVALLGGGDE
jgi:signal transduction histidine kinase